MNLFDDQPTLESLLKRIEALEAKILDKPIRQSQDVPPEIRQAWSLWCLHKAGQKGWTAIAKTKQINKLSTFSQNDPDKAMALVEKAIDRGWNTFFEEIEKPKLSLVQTKTVKQAMAAQETPLERALGHARQRMQRGDFGEGDTGLLAYQSEVKSITARFRDGN